MFCGQQPRFLINPHKNKVHCQLAVSIRQYIADERSLANETLSYGLLPHLSHCISASGKTSLLWPKFLDLAQE